MYEGSQAWLKRVFGPLLEAGVTAGANLLEDAAQSILKRVKREPQVVLTRGEPCGTGEGSTLQSDAGVAGAVREPPAWRGAVPEGHEGGATSESRKEPSSAS